MLINSRCLWVQLQSFREFSLTEKCQRNTLSFPSNGNADGKYCSKRGRAKRKYKTAVVFDTSAASTRCHNETPTMTLNISRGLAVSVEQSPTRQRRRQQTKGATICCRGWEWGKKMSFFFLLLFLQRGGELKQQGLHATHPSKAESARWNRFKQREKKRKKNNKFFFLKKAGGS